MHRPRKTSIAAMLCLLFSMFVFTATPATANAGPCADTLNIQHASLTHLDSDGNTAARVELYADTSRFGICSSNDGNDSSNVSQWVSLERYLGGAAQNIVQVGLVKCGQQGPSFPTTSPCYGSRHGTLRYFYAWGRNANLCPSPYNTSHNPIAIDLGAVGEDAYHVFEVIHDRANGRVRFLIDFVEKDSINDDNVCWLYGSNDNVAAWRTERHNLNDGVPSAIPHRFNNFYYKDITSNLWKTKTFPSCASMTLASSEMKCHYFTTSQYGVSITN